MPLGLAFWIIYLICLIFALWANYPYPVDVRRPFSAVLVIFVLIGLLGWRDFGPPLHG